MRRMAWIALMAGLLFPLLILASDADKAVLIKDVSVSFYMFASAVVGAYMGFSTWGDAGLKGGRDV